MPLEPVEELGLLGLQGCIRRARAA